MSHTSPHIDEHIQLQMQGEEVCRGDFLPVFATKFFLTLKLVTKTPFPEADIMSDQFIFFLFFI